MIHEEGKMKSILNIGEVTAHEFARLLLEMPDYPLVMIGYGKYPNNIEQMRQLVPFERDEIVITFDNRDKINEEYEARAEGMLENEYVEDWIEEVSPVARQIIIERDEYGWIKAFYNPDPTNESMEISGVDRTVGKALLDLMNKMFHIINKSDEEFVSRLIASTKRLIASEEAPEDLKEEARKLLTMTPHTKEFKKQNDLIHDILKQQFGY